MALLMRDACSAQHSLSTVNIEETVLFKFESGSGVVCRGEEEGEKHLKGRQDCLHHAMAWRASLLQNQNKCPSELLSICHY